MKGLDEIKARLEAATPGPWLFDGDRIIDNKVDAEGFMEVICKLPSGRKSDRNAKLLTNAPTDMSRLIARVEKLERALERAENGLNHLAHGTASNPLLLSQATWERASEDLAEDDET